MAPEPHLLYEKLRCRNKLLCHNGRHRFLQPSGIHKTYELRIDKHHSPPTHLCHDTACYIDARHEWVIT